MNIKEKIKEKDRMYNNIFTANARVGWLHATDQEKAVAKSEIENRWERTLPIIKKRISREEFIKCELQEFALKKYYEINE